MYPQDELSRIKMRNRRFVSSCAQEMAMPGMQGSMITVVKFKGPLILLCQIISVECPTNFEGMLIRCHLKLI